MGPNEHRTEGTRQDSRTGCPAETPLSHPCTSPNAQGQTSSAPCCLRVQTHLGLGEGTGVEQREGPSGLEPAWHPTHPYTGAGASDPPSATSCVAGTTTPQSLLQSCGFLSMNHSVPPHHLDVLFGRQVSDPSGKLCPALRDKKGRGQAHHSTGCIRKA